MAYPSPITLAITVAGTNVEDELLGGAVQVISKLGQMTDTCKFTLDDPDVAPVDWDEVIITNGGTKIFAGFMLTSESEDMAKSFTLQYDVEGSDYSVLFEKVIVKAEYEDKTDAYIINDIVTGNSQISGFDGSTYVTAIKTHERKRYNRKTFYEIMDDLANDAQASWYVDWDKNIHFFATEEDAAPYNLSDDPDMAATYPYNRLKVYKDGTQVINKVVVVGGDYRSDDTEFRRKGTGQDAHITMPYRMHAPTTDTSITVHRNDGTEGTPVWTLMTVLVKHIDSLTTTDSVLHNYQEKVLEQTDNWPAFENAVKIYGQYDVPLRSRMRDAASYAFYGRYFDGKIVDESINTKEAGKLAASALLAKQSLAQTVIECDVLEPGLRAGQKIGLTNALQSITGTEYLIHSVDTQVGIGGYSVSSLELGTYEPDIIDIILKLVRSTSQQIIWRDDEVLDEIFDVIEDMTISEGTPSFSAASPPYLWGDVPTTDEGIWDFSTFSSVAVDTFRVTSTGDFRVIDTADNRVTN